MPALTHSVLERSLPSLGSFGDGSDAILSKQNRFWMEDICRFCLLLSDTIVIIGSLVTAYYIRFRVFPHIPSTESFLTPVSQMYLANYYSTIVVGASLQLILLLVGGAYKTRTLLRFRRFLPLLAKSVIIWAIVLPGISLMLEFDQYVSRIFLLLSFALLLTLLAMSRFLLQRVALRLQVTAAFRQRILFVDWTDKTSKIAEAVMRDRWHPYELVGCAPPPQGGFTKAPAAEVPVLGSYQQIETLCEKGLVDIVILSDGHRADRSFFPGPQMRENDGRLHGNPFGISDPPLRPWVNDSKWHSATRNYQASYRSSLKCCCKADHRYSWRHCRTVAWSARS